MEVSIDYDWQPLTPDQMDAIKLQAEQIKGLIENQLMSWTGGPSGTFKTADKVVAPPVQTLSSIDKAKVRSNDDTRPSMCSVCQGTLEERTGKTGKKYCYCANCKDNRMVNGQPFPKGGF